MSKRYFAAILLILMLSNSLSAFAQCQYGSSCMLVNTSCVSDTHHDLIKEFVKAGVEGGIKEHLTISLQIDTSDHIQTAIDKIYSAGGGVILLKEGVYPINSTLLLKDKVILRGENKEKVILESSIRSTWDQGKKNTVYFNNVSHAGIENLTIHYRVDGYLPVDRENWLDGGWCSDCFQNDPHGLTNLYVRQIKISKTSSNCWVDNCNIRNSGTDPILVAGTHNTLRNNFIDRCYNKGGYGNGYYDVRGDYNLIFNETVKRVRHFAVQQGAKYNVIIENKIEGDVNFHSGDDGYNLLEKNNIKLPTWHGWDIFGTGGAQYGHKPPGDKNILVNNTSNYKNQGSRYADPDVIYTFTDYGAPVATRIAMPKCNTFYPMYSNSTLALKGNRK